MSILKKINPWKKTVCKKSIIDSIDNKMNESVNYKKNRWLKWIIKNRLSSINGIKESIVNSIVQKCVDCKIRIHAKKLSVEKNLF